MGFSVEILIILVIILLYLHHYFKQRKIVKFFEQFPHAPYLPILGNALDFKNTTVYLTSLDRYVKQYGGTVAIKVGLTKRFLLVTDYNLAAAILSSTKLLTKSRFYRFLDPWLGQRVLNATGHQWKINRRLVTPTFHTKVLENYVDVFDKQSDVLLEKFEEIGNTKSVDIMPFITLCSLDIACEVATGVPSQVQKGASCDYVAGVKRICSLALTRAYSVIKNNDFLYRFTSDFHEQNRTVNILHRHSEEVIHKYFESQQRNDAKTSFLSVLLKGPNDPQLSSLHAIREYIDGFVFAAHDTTSTALNFTIYSLANHPDVQFKVFEEQRILFNNNQNATLTYDDLQQMTYLEMVIKESMRQFPPVATIGRRTTEDINIGGLSIPTGVDIMLYFRGIHMNPELFPDPDKFEPNRFSNSNGGGKRLPYSYLPFSAGPRNCIGQKLAMLIMKVVLSKLIRNFELVPASPPHQLELASELVMISTSGIRIGLRRRTQQDYV